MLSSGCSPFLSAFNIDSEQYYKRSGVTRQWEIAFFGRSTINKGVIVPGYVVPSHGKLNTKDKFVLNNCAWFILL